MRQDPLTPKRPLAFLPPFAFLPLVAACHQRSVRDRMAAVAGPVGLAGGGQRIERLAHGAIAHRVDVRREALPVERHDDLAQDPGIMQRPATLPAGPAADIEVRIEQRGRRRRSLHRGLQALHLAARIAHDAMARSQLALGMTQRGFQTHLGKHAGPGESGFNAVHMVDVTPDQADSLAAAEAAQFAAKLLVTHRHGERCHARIGVARIVHQANQFGSEQARILKKTLEGKIAGQQHPFQMTVDAGIVIKRHSRVAAQCIQP